MTEDIEELICTSGDFIVIYMFDPVGIFFTPVSLLLMGVCSNWQLIWC